MFSGRAAYQPSATRDETGTLFGQTMGLGRGHRWPLPALGAYLGRNLSPMPLGLGVVPNRGARSVRVGINFTVQRSEQLAIVLLFAFGVLIGLAMAPTIGYYASTDPQALWQAGGATGLFIAGFGAGGYAIRRDLAPFARFFFWALIALIVFGIVLDLRSDTSGGSVIYSILGLVIFAGFTMFDFQRLRRGKDIRTAPLLAASIFLDILNVFVFFLSLFGRRS